MNWRRMLGTAAMLCALSILGAGCGVPETNTPQLVPTNQLPDSLVDDVRTSPLQPSRDQTVTLFFLRDRRLVRSLQVMTVPSLTRAEDLAQDVIDKLVAGPSASQRKAGFQSLVARVASTDSRTPIVINLVTDGTVRVDLGRTRLNDLPAEDQILALAQIVFTLTSLSGIGRVEFLSDTKEIIVLTGQGPRTGEVFASLYECAERGQCAQEAVQPAAVTSSTSTSTTVARRPSSGAIATS